MERQGVQPDGTLTKDFALEEYRALNAEILERVRRQNAFVGFAMLAASALITTTSLWVTFPGATLVLLGFSFILWIVVLIFVEQDFQIALIGNYIRDILYPAFGVDKTKLKSNWENYRSEKLHRLPLGVQVSMAGKYGFMIAPMVIIDLVAIPLTGGPAARQIGGTWWPWSVYGIVVLAKYLTAAKALIDASREYGMLPTRASGEAPPRSGGDLTSEATLTSTVDTPRSITSSMRINLNDGPR